MWLTAALSMAACNFTHGALSHDGGGDDDSGTNIDIDAPLADAMVDVPPGQTCVGSQGSMLVVCYQPGSEPANPYNPTNNIDTNNNCDQVKGQSFPNPELCIKQGSSITISGNLRVTGGRPLVLVSLSAITISGSLDASNGGAGATPFSCNFGQEDGSNESSNSSSSGAGGGGGGGFGTGGGNGGDGSQSGGNGVPSIGLNAIRGGCPGGSGGDTSNGNGGNGGVAGGAIYLIAKNSINVPGTILANGQHGRGGGGRAGGGGGGSGGMIGFDAPVVTVDGTAMANGGGGGEGGDSNETGNDGQDPVVATYDQRAPGGMGGADNGGNGGGGSVLTMGGAGGAGGGNAGGGGGGGGGRVRRYPAGMGLAGKISPPAP
jgi:hypothetical protein